MGMLEFYKLQHALTIHEMNMRMCHWACHGPNFHEMHDMFSDYETKAGRDLDEIVEIILMDKDFPTAWPDLPESGQKFIIVSTEHSGQMISDCRQSIEDLVQAFTAVRNLPDLLPAIQSKIDDMIYYWTKESNYKLRRMIAN